MSLFLTLNFLWLAKYCRGGGVIPQPPCSYGHDLWSRNEISIYPCVRICDCNARAPPATQPS